MSEVVAGVVAKGVKKEKSQKKMRKCRSIKSSENIVITGEKYFCWNGCRQCKHWKGEMFTL